VVIVFPKAWKSPKSFLFPHTNFSTAADSKGLKFFLLSCNGMRIAEVLLDEFSFSRHSLKYGRRAGRIPKYSGFSGAQTLPFVMVFFPSVPESFLDEA
jgi:hypothetical protein